MDLPRARPLAVDDSVARGLRLMGVAESEIDAALADAEQAKDAPDFDFDVYEECMRSVTLFLAVGTQWVWRVRSRPAGLGTAMWSVRAGLHYPGVESALRMGGVKRGEWAQLFEDLRVMEQAVLEHEAKDS